MTYKVCFTWHSGTISLSYVFLKLLLYFDMSVPLWLKWYIEFVWNVSSLSDFMYWTSILLNLCEMSVVYLILCTGRIFCCNTCCGCDMLFSFWFHNLLDTIWWVWCFHFFILRDVVFIAAMVSLGWHYFLCKGESKACFLMWHILQHALCFLSESPVLYQHAWQCWILQFHILMQFSFARVTILFKSLHFHSSCFSQN